jgi:hypothetical protein
MTQPEAVLLSLLGPRPVSYRNPKFPDVLCAWNGILMTQNHALMLAGEYFWSQGPTPEMRHTADRRFLLLYQAGAFENSDSWHNVVLQNTFSGSMHQWYRIKLKPHVERSGLLGTKPQEVFQWFNLAQWSKDSPKNH